MYKLLLCWRYLRTRYLALVCIVSVMLGVATLIVVNSVMSGFSTKLRDRLHGLLSDWSSSRRASTASPIPKKKWRRIRESPIGQAHRGHDADDRNLRHAPVRPLQQRGPSATVTRPVHLIGVDSEGRMPSWRLSGTTWSIQKDSPNPSFELPPDAKIRYRMNNPPLIPPPPFDAQYCGPERSTAAPAAAELAEGAARHRCRLRYCPLPRSHREGG